MDISTLFISLISLLIGISATIYVTKHYFNRTIEKSLTPFIDYSAHFLENIDQEVKKDLSIKYQNNEVDELTQMQFLIANNGERPIRDLIKPLELHIPEGAVILDSSILHVSPEGRDISISIDDSKKVVLMSFQLLNKDEFFIIKLLINGDLKSKDLKFTISVDDLPPVLPIESLPYNMIATEDEPEESSFEYWLFISGIAALVAGLSPIYLAYQIDLNWPFFSVPDLQNFTSNITLLHVSKVLVWPIGVICSLIGVGMIVASYDSIQIGKKNKFLIPEGISHRHQHRKGITFEEAAALRADSNINIDD